MSISDLKVERPERGPNKLFEGTNFDFKDLRFPPGVGNNPRLLHCIKFTPTVQNKSSYDVKTTGLRNCLEKFCLIIKYLKKLFNTINLNELNYLLFFVLF